MKKYKKHDYNNVYKMIVQYWRENYRSPSIRDIGEACDISSTSHVLYIANSLKADGRLLKITGRTQRGYIPLVVVDALSKMEVNNETTV